MKREIYLDCTPGQIRAAVVEDGVLRELHIERQTAKKLTETVFLGRVEQIRPSVGAAFVDIGQPLSAFLPLEDGKKLRCGEMIIVQGAAKQATESKGLRVSDRLNLAGKWLVLVPQGRGIHISKKVKDPALREALAQCAQDICPPDCGLIVRTASEGVTREAMEDESERLHAQWLDISRKANTAARPCILSESRPLDVRLVRDLGSKELSCVMTNDAACFSRLLTEQQEGRLSRETQVKHYDETRQLMFDVFAIEAQIDKALKRRVWLPCGGYLIIDACEAMTVIDVNSGKMTLGKDTEDTALRVNLEAAQEIARQIRLRDIGGIIVVDFIDMQVQENRTAIIKCMKESVKADRSPVKVEGITRLGLLEMTRKRVNATLQKSLQSACSYCGGTGALVSPEETAQRALRQVRRSVLAGQRGPFVIKCFASVAAALVEEICPVDAPVYALGVTSRHAERFDIEQLGKNDPVPKGAQVLNKGMEP